MERKIDKLIREQGIETTSSMKSGPGRPKKIKVPKPVRVKKEKVVKTKPIIEPILDPIGLPHRAPKFPSTWSEDLKKEYSTHFAGIRAKKEVRKYKGRPAPAQAAYDRGEKYYRKGSPCKRGHEDKRYSSNGACVECQKLHSKEYAWKSPVKFAESQIRYNVKRKDFFQNRDSK